jgi:hypothetical protein
MPWLYLYGCECKRLEMGTSSHPYPINSLVLMIHQFKIDEAGLINGTVATGTWAAKYMIDQNNSWTSTIPSSVPTGNYLIRFETIALHAMPAVIFSSLEHRSILIKTLKTSNYTLNVPNFPSLMEDPWPQLQRNW